MELRHLRYFIAVAEEENVTRAATRLHVSQPPLTRQIHDLEAELDCRLFHRTGNSIRLTQAGRTFLKEARAILRRVEMAIHSVRQTKNLGGSEWHLGYAPSPTAGLLPLILKKLRAYPGKVVLHDLASPQMLAGLRDGSLHAAFMMQPTRQASRGIEFHPLRRYPIVAAVPPGHALAGQHALSVPRLLNEPAVAYSHAEYPDYHDFLKRILGPSAKRLRIEEECDSGTSLLAAVESGKGIAIVSSIFEKTCGQRLRLIPLTPAPAPAVVGLAHLVKPASVAAVTFVERLQKMVLSLGEDGGC